MKDTKPSIKINGNDIAKYQIVISDEASINIRTGAANFQSHINSLIGMELPIVTDKTPESKYEILIGTSDREKSTELLKTYEPSENHYKNFYIKLDGNTLILNAANAYGVPDAVNAALSSYFFKGADEIPSDISLSNPCGFTGLSMNMRHKGMARLTANVEQPSSFAVDLAKDENYFAEEDNTSNWSYENGEYVTTAKKEHNLSYIHIYEANVDYTAKLKYSAAGTDGDMALIARFVGKYAYVKAGYDFKASEWYIEYREGEDFYIFRVASVKATLTEGKLYTVNFKLDGRCAELAVDGVQLLRSDKLEHVTPGRIGVWAKDATVAVNSVSAVLLSGEGTVLRGIYHTNFRDGKRSCSTSFFELSDGSMYAHVPGYLNGYLSKDGGQTWVEDTFNRIGHTSVAHPIRLVNGDLLQINPEGEDVLAFTSKDDGVTWTKTGVVMPITNTETGYSHANQNDKIMQAPGGRLFYGASINAAGDTKHLVEFYYSDDDGKTWARFPFNNRDIVGLENIDRFAESKMIECADGSLRVYTSWGGMFGCMHYFESTDGGKTWGPNTLMTGMYAPSSSYQIVRDPYGETDYTYYIVWVYAKAWGRPSIANRSRLALAKSTDGKSWKYIGDIWRWEAQYNHHNGPFCLNQIVNPSVGASREAIFIASGVSERIRPDGNAGTHGDIQNHVWVIRRDCIPEGKPINSFSDLKIGASYYNAVTYVTERGLIAATSAETFEPDAFMSRDAFVDALDSLGGVASNIDLDDYVTVEQACTALLVCAGGRTAKGAAKLTLSSFTDAASVSSWAADGVEWALANGIYTGQNGTIKGQEQASRALVATMLYNFVNVFGE